MDGAQMLEELDGIRYPKDDAWYIDLDPVFGSQPLVADPSMFDAASKKTAHLAPPMARLWGFEERWLPGPDGDREQRPKRGANWPGFCWQHPAICCERCAENGIPCVIAKTTAPKGGPTVQSIGLKKCWGCSQRSQTPCSLTSDTGAAKMCLRYNLRKHSWRIIVEEGTQSDNGDHPSAQANDCLDDDEGRELGPPPIAGNAGDVAEAGGTVRDARSAVWHAVKPFVAGDLVMTLPRLYPHRKSEQTKTHQTSTAAQQTIADRWTVLQKAREAHQQAVASVEAEGLRIAREERDLKAQEADWSERCERLRVEAGEPEHVLQARSHLIASSNLREGEWIFRLDRAPGEASSIGEGEIMWFERASIIIDSERANQLLDSRSGAEPQGCVVRLVGRYHLLRNDEETERAFPSTMTGARIEINGSQGASSSSSCSSPGRWAGPNVSFHDLRVRQRQVTCTESVVGDLGENPGDFDLMGELYMDWEGYGL